LFGLLVLALAFVVTGFIIGVVESVRFAYELICKIGRLIYSCFVVTIPPFNFEFTKPEPNTWVTKDDKTWDNKRFTRAVLSADTLDWIRKQASRSSEPMHLKSRLMQRTFDAFIVAEVRYATDEEVRPTVVMPNEKCTDRPLPIGMVPVALRGRKSLGYSNMAMVILEPKVINIGFRWRADPSALQGCLGQEYPGQWSK
jgi:hypothetical protein